MTRWLIILHLVFGLLVTNLAEAISDCVDADGDSYGVGADCIGPDIDDSASSCTTDAADTDSDGVMDCVDLCGDTDGDEYGTDWASAVIGEDADQVGNCTTDGSTPCSFADVACTGIDCDDDDSEINPGQIDIPGDDTDDNCDDTVACYVDADDDQFGTTSSEEVTAYGATDGHADTAGACDSSSTDGYADTSTDCDDSNASIHPGATEVCGDGVDANCDDIGGPLGDEDSDGCSWTEEDAVGTSDCDDDSDNDFLDDFIELGGNCAYDAGETDPLDDDSDDDSLLDGEEDRNANGTEDTGETDPLDADTDDDGVADGDEDINANGTREGNETDPTDSDTDNDLLNDGLEQGLTSGVPAGTSLSGYPYAGTSGWSPDAHPLSTTDPVDADTDNDGINDGAEDANGNGQVNAAETDPGDADTDDDGVADNDESIMALNPLNPDTDSDGLNDGLEIGRNTPVPSGISSGFSIPYSGTDTNFWIPDSNPATVTDPLDQDSDNDGLEDGFSEDLNGNGHIDGIETDPADADSDDDGVEDGDETGLGLDPLDADSDSDELSDGLELGRDQSVAAGRSSGTYAPNQVVYLGTDLGVWSPDSDNSTTTDPDDSDSDDDNLNDGVEDADHDGLKDAAESDPLDPDTDDDGWCDDSRSDNDGDGIDPIDSCDSSEKDNGTSPVMADTDSDTVTDPLDNCPVDFNPEQLDANSDGIGDVCDSQNICFDPDTELQGEDYSGFVYCAAANSIVAGGVDPGFVPDEGQEFGVRIGETGRVVFSTPTVDLVPPFEVATGGTFSVGLSLVSPCDLTGFSATGQTAQQDPGSIFYRALSSAGEPYDALVIELYAPLSTGTFQLTGENYADCAQCVTVFTGCTTSFGCDKTFLASGGTLNVSSIDTVFQGSVDGLELVEVTIDPATYVSTPVPDGSTYCIPNWDFSAAY